MLLISTIKCWYLIFIDIYTIKVLERGIKYSNFGCKLSCWIFLDISRWQISGRCQRYQYQYQYQEVVKVSRFSIAVAIFTDIQGNGDNFCQKLICRFLHFIQWNWNFVWTSADIERNTINWSVLELKVPKGFRPFAPPRMIYSCIELGWADMDQVMKKL